MGATGNRWQTGVVMSSPQLSWNPRFVVRNAVATASVAMLALVAVLPGAAPAVATPTGDSGGPGVIATGLDNPRLLSFSDDGDLFIAESGRGGDGPCVTGPEGEVCFGLSGAVTRVRDGRQSRVLRGLPSLAGTGGGSASGPSDVVTWGRGYAVLLGLGNDPAVRAKLPPSGRLLGTLAVGRFGHGRPWLLADLAGYEDRVNPAGADKDSNPTGLAASREGFTVADAGANAVLRVDWRRRIRTVAVLPSRPVTAPPIPGLPPTVQMQSVPTSAAQSPDGAWYVSELTGFPFPVGASTIWRIGPGGKRSSYATGLTTVTDLAWYRGRLYAVQLADKGLLGVPAGQLPTGSLVEVSAGAATHRSVAAGLTAPYGVAMRKGAAYLTTCAMCAGGGQVVRVPLD